MDINEIMSLIDKLESTKISELSINNDNFNLTIVRENIQSKDVVVEMPLHVENNDTPRKETTTLDSTDTEVKSPLVGVYYETSSPDSPPYIKVGDKVKKGDILCIIEAMKIFNEIQSPCDGIIKKIYASSQEIVEYDQPLVIIGKDTE